MGASCSTGSRSPESMYADAYAEGVDGVEWKEERHVFRESYSSDESELVSTNYRNVVTWKPKDNAIKVKGVVLICHGVLAHTLCHQKEAVAFVKAGYAVYGMDHVGHGVSSGDRGRIDSYEELVDDYITFANSMVALHPSNTPVILYGHSLGAMITCLSTRNITNVKGIILTGVPYKVGPGTASLFGCRCLYPLSQLSFISKLGACLAVIDPKGPTAPLYIEECTSSPEQLALIKLDPRRCHMWTMNATATTALNMVDQLKYTDVLNTIKLPVYQVHGADDQIGLLDGAIELFTKIGTISQNKTLKIINNFKHEVCGEIEPQSSEVVSGMINFADQWIEVAKAETETEVISSSPISASLSARKLVPIGNSNSNAI
jgi:acylglycerol lipase